MIKMQRDGDDAAAIRQWRFGDESGDRSIEETRLNEFLKEEFDVAQFRILDTDGLQHAQIAVLHRHEDGTQMLKVRTHQVQRRAEVFNRL